MGLDAILPNMRDAVARYDPQWTFSLKTDRRSMQYNGTIDFLNYEPHGRMVYIGAVRQVEHAWLMMVPRTAIGAAINTAGVPSYKSIRPMDSRSVRAVFMMLAYMLSQIKYSHVHVRRRYPSLEDDKEISEFANNI